jgi:outer membrane receptor protein involved in Fe transport
MSYRRFLICVALASLSTAAFAGSSAKAKRPAPPPAEDGYYVPYVTGRGGQKVPVMEIPGSVTVISRKFMDDVQAISLGDALRYAPGVTVMGR